MKPRITTGKLVTSTNPITRSLSSRFNIEVRYTQSYRTIERTYKDVDFKC